MFVKRHIQPEYHTGLCSPALLETIKCGFALQMYSIYAKEKYGIDMCINDEYDKYFIKTELLNLNMLYDPNACVLPPCPCPCNVQVELKIFNFKTQCLAPKHAIVDIDILPSQCVAPNNATPYIVYDLIKNV